MLNHSSLLSHSSNIVIIHGSITQSTDSTMPSEQDKNQPNDLALADYIRHVFKDKKDTPLVEQIFHRSISPPMLKRGRKNRILIYPGCFNPPHIGHLGLLIHCFRAGQAHLNFIAALICLVNTSVLWKDDFKSSSEALSETVRAKLWNQDPRFPEWAWIFPEDSGKASDFVAQLREASKKDGFDIDFLSISGADKFCYGAALSLPYWGCFEIITSNISRRNDYIQRDALHQLEDFEEWEALPVEGHKKEIPLDTVSDASPAHANVDVVAAGSQDDILCSKPCKREDIRICRHWAEKSKVIYFVPSSKLGTEISSTQLRESLRNQAREIVEKFALSPKLLLEAWRESRCRPTLRWYYG